MSTVKLLKQVIGLILWNLISIYAYSQWTEGVSIWNTSSSKAVGIGTSSPTTKLQVVGDVRIGTNAAYTDIKLFTDTAQAGYSGTVSIAPFSVPGSGMAKQLTWFKTNVNGSGSGSTRHDVKIDGMLSIGESVGIGTANPTEKLTVNGNIKTKKLIVTQLGWAEAILKPKN